MLQSFKIHKCIHFINRSLSSLLRSHQCNQITSDHQGKSVTIAGWIHAPRNIGPELIFIKLRDESGTAQIVVNADSKVNFNSDQSIQELQELSPESVISVTGIIQKRPPENVTRDPNGDVELHLLNYEILNRCDPLPFSIKKGAKMPSEEFRLKHRYLDLRRPILNQNLRTRSRVTSLIRKTLEDEGLVEIETPYLFKSTPEGAREFIVPSRDPGLFYALPQSPQQYKQILM